MIKLPSPTPLLENLESTAVQGIDWLLANFPRECHTLQFIPSTTLASKSRAYPVVETYPDTPTTRNNLIADCLKYNKKGYNCFFMVQPGDGVTKSHGKTVRNRAAVTHFTHLYFDADGCELDTILTYLTSINVTPHNIVESSPGRFHVYIAIETLNTQHEYKWKTLQTAFAYLGNPHNDQKSLGIDLKSMRDISRILRIPGLIHVDKHCVSVVHSQSFHPPYDFFELYTLANAEEFKDLASAPLLIPDDGVTIYGEGHRFERLQSQALVYANMEGLSPQEKLVLFTHYANTRIDNTDPEFVLDGQLTQKSLSLIHSALEKVEKEREAREFEERKKIVAILNRQEQSPWHLDPEFFLSAPNGFGDVVKDMLKGSFIPLAPLAFSTALAALSAVKSVHWRCPLGKSPALYILNVAPSSSGKASPLAIINRTFNKHDAYRDMVFDSIASTEGLGRQLASSNSVGFWHTDEIAGILGILQDKNAQALHKKLHETLLKLYNISSERLVWTAMKADIKENAKQAILHYPALAICGYMVNRRFSEVFTLQSLVSGLLGRFVPFIINPIDLPERRNIHYDSEMTINHPLFLSNAQDAQALIEIEETSGSINNTSLPTTVQPESVSPTPSTTTPLMARNPPKMPWRSQEVAERFNELDHALYEDYRSSAIADDDAAAIYGRISENAERIATCLSIHSVGMDELNFAFTLMKNRLAAMTHQVGRMTLSDTPYSRSMRKIKEKIVNLIQDSPDGKTTRSAVLKNSDTDGYTLTKILRDLEEMGAITIDTPKGDPGKAGRRPTYIALANVLS